LAQYEPQSAAIHRPSPAGIPERPSAPRLSEAERLSAGHSELIGTPSLDILHVAGALVLGAEQFVTLETRQATLARAAGLRVPAIE
jgi:hypothetical protein